MRYGSRARPSKKERGGEGGSSEVRVQTGVEEEKEELQEGEWVGCVQGGMQEGCSLPSAYVRGSFSAYVRGLFSVVALDDSVVNEWDELDDVTEDVKENWDDSEGEVECEGEMKSEGTKVEPVSASPTRDEVPVHVGLVQEASIADEGDSDVSDESESNSESEDDSLSAAESQRARVLRRLQVASIATTAP